MPVFEITAPDGRTFEVEGPEGATQEDALAQVQAQYQQPEQAAPQESARPQPAAPRNYFKDVKRQLGRTARIGADAVAAIPLAISDFGIGARNLVTGSNYEDASSMYRGAMDQILPKAEGTAEKAVDVVGQMAIGSKLPNLAPQIGNVPQNFVRPPSVRDATLAASQEAGYVVPPTTTNPTITNQLLEGAAGKLSTAQKASEKNMAVTNKLAARALGLGDDTPLTQPTLDRVRADAGKAYEAVAKLGKFDGSKLPKSVQVSEDVSPLLMGKQKTVDASELVRAWKQANHDSIEYLRAYGRDANPETLAKSKAFKAEARQIDEFITKQLESMGKGELVKQLKEARTLIAKTYTVENALNASTGNVAAPIIAKQLDKGAPLTGELRQIGEFGNAFPKAAREMNESLPAVSPLDFYASGGASVLSGNLLPLLYPFARYGAREGLLSQAGQRLAVPSQAVARPQTAQALSNFIANPEMRR